MRIQHLPRKLPEIMSPDEENWLDRRRRQSEALQTALALAQ